MKSLSDIRQHFLDYFERHDHRVVPSSSLVPHNDPTLLFTNAGMVPFKNVFTGLERRDYKTAASSQKCVRAGGKHNDLENVGHTARHHTFFEMLGNFSFGDYFKEKAIDLAWTLITKEFEIPKAKLLVTVYADDEEAATLWKKIAGLADDKIIRIPTADNFWSMGPTGPCGPCSEIFYDHGDKIPGGPPGSPEQDGDRFVEIWNLVFMQFEQIDAQTRRELPQPSIDTGMGLERISAVLQGKCNNYDTDLFQAIIKTSMELSRTPESVSHRVLADHLRSSGFLIADGIMPSNEGRGYVLRRIMRRAMRHAHMLGHKEPLMHKLVPVLIAEMGGAYPELARAQSLITETLKLEEERFKTTLEKGLKLLEEETAKLQKSQAFPGDVAFKLYDTYGFPLDLTQDVLKAEGRDVDETGFQRAMSLQKAEARSAWVGSGEKADEQIWFDLRQKLGSAEFLGYDTCAAEGIVTAILEEGQIVSQAAKGKKAQFLTNQTPFYGESGGQTGDSGVAVTPDKTSLTIYNTVKKLGELHVHEAEITEGILKVGDKISLSVDVKRRKGLQAHHSATHLLHQALRKILGDHVTQKGSLVKFDRLRFDFSYPKAVPADIILRIENRVNSIIRHNSDARTMIMKPEEAIKAGALALFGEKYSDEVRVVSLGEEDDGSLYSTELCGGTHVHRTGDIGYFKIISEAGVAAGIRRFEALAGEAAELYMREKEETLNDVARLLKARPAEITSRLTALLEEKKKLEKELKKTRHEESKREIEIERIKGIQFASQVLKDTAPKELKPMVDALKKQIGSGVAAVASSFEGKASLVVGVTDDLTSKFSAVDLVIAGAKAIGGKGGGGRADMAQAGGTDINNLNKAIECIKNVLQ